MTDTAGYDLGSVGSPPPLYDQVEPKRKTGPAKMSSGDPVARAESLMDKAEKLEEQKQQDPAYQAATRKLIDVASKGTEPIGDKLQAWDAAKETAAHTTDPLQAFGSAASIFAVLASAFTHTPAINAMNGMAAAINAIHAGDEEAYKRAYEAWKANTDLMIERHNAMHEDYQDALKGGETTLEVLADKYDDPAMKQLAIARHYVSIGQLVDARQKNALEAERTRQEIEINAPKAAAATALYAAQKSGDPQKIQTAIDRVKAVEMAFSPTAGTLTGLETNLFNQKVAEFQQANGRDPTPDEQAAILQGVKGSGGGFGSGLKARFDQNMERAGGEVLRSLKMLEPMDIDTTGGLFEGANKGFKGYLSGRLQAQEQGFFDSAFGGMDVEIGNLLKNGLNVTEGVAHEMVEAFKPVPSDTNLNALFKLSNLAAKTRTALENMFPADPDAKAKKQQILDALAQYPTPEEVFKASQSDEPITAKTYGEALQQIREKFGEATPTKQYKSALEVVKAYKANELSHEEAAKILRDNGWAE